LTERKSLSATYPRSKHRGRERLSPILDVSVRGKGLTKREKIYQGKVTRGKMVLKGKSKGKL